MTDAEQTNKWNTKQHNRFQKIFMIVVLDQHSVVTGWQLTSKVLEKSLLGTPVVCMFCLNGISQRDTAVRLSSFALQKHYLEELEAEWIPCSYSRVHPVQGWVARSPFWSGDVNNRRCPSKNDSKQFAQVPALHCISIRHSHHDWSQLDEGNHNDFFFLFLHPFVGLFWYFSFFLMCSTFAL